MPQWLAENWVILIPILISLGGLWFSGYASHKETQARKEETKARRISNLLAVTASHRDVWEIFLTNKDLARVREVRVNTTIEPVTDAERIFVNLVIQHINSVYQATNDQLFISLEGLRRDIAKFFSLPIPHDVWKKIENSQNGDFVAFVNSCRNWK